MGCVFFARRGEENIYWLGTSASSDSRMLSVVLKDPVFHLHRSVETEVPSECEKFLEGYFGSHRVGRDPLLFRFPNDEIEHAVEVARSFVAKFLPVRKAAQSLCNLSTDRQYVVPTQRQSEIYQKLKAIREEEYRLQLRREFLENELKVAIGTAAACEGSRVGVRSFRSDSTAYCSRKRTHRCTRITRKKRRYGFFVCTERSRMRFLQGHVGRRQSHGKIRRG